MNGRPFALCAMTAILLGSACSGSHGAQETTNTCKIAVDRFKELEIVDEAVIKDARSLNGSNGAWSFRHLVEQIVPAGQDPGDFVLHWLENWAAARMVNGLPVDTEPGIRDAYIQDRMICAWLKQSPANACDATCATCAAKKLDLAKAPFRLLAIANRIDLSTKPNEGPSGEARIVFGLTAAADAVLVADDPASPTKAMTLAFEYELPSSLSLKEWASAWHDLGKYPQFDESYKAALEALTNRFVARGTTPTATNGSSMLQIRTNESYFDWIWQLREFRLAPNGDLELTTVKNNPAAKFNGSAALQAWANTNKDLILKEEGIVPEYMLGGAADQFGFKWNVPGVDEPVRVAFARSTCSGCHSEGENPPIDTAFHVSPFRPGVAKLSQFLNDPLNPGKDELSRREGVLSDALCKP